jgi:hypothetical protein
MLDVRRRPQLAAGRAGARRRLWAAGWLTLWASTQ